MTTIRDGGILPRTLKEIEDDAWTDEDQARAEEAAQEEDWTADDYAQQAADLAELLRAEDPET